MPKVKHPLADDEIVELLEEIARDRDGPPAARVSAMRQVREIREEQSASAARNQKANVDEFGELDQLEPMRTRRAGSA
jgi:hypothetical protein